MADEMKPSAISGEIVTGAGDRSTAAKPGQADRSAVVIDADYISLPPGFEAVPRPRQSEPPAKTAGATVGSVAAPQAGLDTLRRQDAAAPVGPRRGGPLFWVTGIALVLASFWVSGGHALVRDIAFATAQQKSALRISGVTSRIEETGPKAILLVDGEVANDGTTTEHLPVMEIAVTANDNVVTRYRLGTSGRPLMPGDIFTFSSRLDAPTSGVKTVSVAFAE